jgi:hypothetical protein
MPSSLEIWVLSLRGGLALNKRYIKRRGYNLIKEGVDHVVA